MTRTCWLAACAAALLLGGSTAWAQCPSSRAHCPSSAPSCDLPCAPQAPEAARAPYYNELPHIVFPPHAPALSHLSNPVVWERLFEAVASYRCKCCADGQPDAACGPREHSRHKSHDRRMTGALLKLYRFYYRTGHYHAAEFMAAKALPLDPSNIAAEAALCMARLAADAIDHGQGDGDYEDCEASAAPAPRCGMCVGSAVASGVCKGCCKSAKASCACGKDCGCGRDEPCACGADCCCKKARRQNVRRPVHPVMVPPMMMCPACPFCPAFQAAPPPPVRPMFPRAVPGMVPPPAPQMFLPNPPMNVMAPNMACPPGALCCPWAAPVPAAQAERLPPPRVVSNPMPAMGLVSAPANPPTRGPLRISVCGSQVCLRCPGLKACCNNVTSLPDGRALLEGDVCVTFTRADRPAKVQAQRMIVDLEDGSWEVSPVRLEAQGIKPISYKECPCRSEKKLLLTS